VAEVVGEVSVLRRYPVKSMQGERLTTVSVRADGVWGDRAYAVLDLTSGQLVRGKTPEVGPLVLACRASLAAEPVIGHDLPPVVVELPDGTCVKSDSDDADDLLSRYFGRPVRLVSTAPPASAFVADRSTFLETAGVPALVPDLSLQDASPVSVLTTSTLDRLAVARPETLFDHRRFRMNVIVASTGAGFVENDWPGRCLSLGATRLQVAMPTPRCSLTTMAQEDLPRDLAVLRTAARENSLPIGHEKLACVGVYATVHSAGEITVGDRVSLEGPLVPLPQEALR
jgi:uncharacterized protein YcbX